MGQCYYFMNGLLGVCMKDVAKKKTGINEVK